jgi:hypothetical protein
VLSGVTHQHYWSLICSLNIMVNTASDVTVVTVITVITVDNTVFKKIYYGC